MEGVHGGCAWKAGFADTSLSAVQPRTALCTFDKWLYFYILIGNRNNTSEAWEKPQFPAQAENKSVSNERERLSQRKKIICRKGRGEFSTAGWDGAVISAEWSLLCVHFRLDTINFACDLGKHRGSRKPESGGSQLGHERPFFIYLLFLVLEMKPRTITLSHTTATSPVFNF